MELLDGDAVRLGKTLVKLGNLDLLAVFKNLFERIGGDHKFLQLVSQFLLHAQGHLIAALGQVDNGFKNVARAMRFQVMDVARLGRALGFDALEIGAHASAVCGWIGVLEVEVSHCFYTLVEKTLGFRQVRALWKTGGKGMKSLNSIVVAFQFPSCRAEFGILEVAVDDQKLKCLLVRRPGKVRHGILHGDGGTLVIPCGVVDFGILEGLGLQLVAKAIHHGLAAVTEAAAGIPVHEELQLIDGGAGVGLVQRSRWRQIKGAQGRPEQSSFNAGIVGVGLGESLEVVLAQVEVIHAVVGQSTVPMNVWCAFCAAGKLHQLVVQRQCPETIARIQRGLGKIKFFLQVA